MSRAGELKIVCACFAAVALLCITPASFAHRAPGSLTTISWNAVSGRTEVVHRLHTHDAETAVGAFLGVTGLSVGEVEGRAHIALYVEQHFEMKYEAGDNIRLELLGAELSGDYILVYQESTIRLANNIKIRDDILREAFPAQFNQVNIEDGDRVHSLIFTKDDTWLSYRFLN